MDILPKMNHRLNVDQKFAILILSVEENLILKG